MTDPYQDILKRLEKLELQKTKSLRPVKNNDEKLKQLLRRPKKLNQHLTQYKQK